MRRAILLTAALASALLLIILGAAPARAQSVQLVPFGGQTYASPYYVTGEPGNPGRVYVVEGAGTIRLVEDGALRFREQGTLPHPNATPHDYAAYVASDRRPSGAEVGSRWTGRRPARDWPIPTATST